MMNSKLTGFLRHNVLLALSLVICFICSGCSTSGKKDSYHGLTAEEIYNQGEAHAHKGRFELAIKDFEALEARYPYGEFADKGQLALVYAYYKRGENASALAAADRFIRLNPKHKNIDYAHYLKGLINYDQNFSAAFRYLPLDRSKRDPTLARQAFDDFALLIEKYPDSKYAVDAQSRMQHLKNQLAAHELHVAELYMAKGAYLAAANRAGHVVQHFDQTPSVPKALKTMFNAYNKLGMAELANDARNTLQNNFPETTEAKSVQQS